ncbi:hypothetical protein F4778DRAFT_368764 [Xylariomycetidae sp. FL2044]|nr:hypothetical protein F4778DRAFT_368764 [Xylariomycetidae sp. FL2044]
MHDSLGHLKHFIHLAFRAGPDFLIPLRYTLVAFPHYTSRAILVHHHYFQRIPSAAGAEKSHSASYPLVPAKSRIKRLYSLNSGFEDVFHLMVFGTYPSAAERETLRHSFAQEMMNVPDTVFNAITAFP